MSPCSYLQLVMAGVMQAELAAVGLCMDVKLSEACMCWAEFLSGIESRAAVLVLAGGRGGGHARAGGGRGPARGRQAARGSGRGRARHHAPPRADAGAWPGQPPARVCGKSCQASAVLVFCMQQGSNLRVFFCDARQGILTVWMSWRPFLARDGVQHNQKNVGQVKLTLHWRLYSTQVHSRHACKFGMEPGQLHMQAWRR